jgi:hypothetical protein
VAAHTLVAQIEGVLSLVRNSQDPEDLVVGARGLRAYLDSIRASGPRLGADEKAAR